MNDLFDVLDSFRSLLDPDGFDIDQTPFKTPYSLSVFEAHSRRRHNGSQVLFNFPNGYGASVVRHAGSYGASDGLFELAVIIITGQAEDDFELTYATPITDDVIGSLNEGGVTELLERIKALPERPRSHG